MSCSCTSFHFSYSSLLSFSGIRIKWSFFHFRERSYYTGFYGEVGVVYLVFGANIGGMTSPSSPVPVIVGDLESFPRVSLHSLPCHISTEEGKREANVKDHFETTIIKKQEGVASVIKEIINQSWNYFPTCRCWVWHVCFISWSTTSRSES